jgi:hypothetical protein
MVAAAILLSVGLAVAYLTTSPRFNAADMSNTQDACRAVANEVLNRVREHGSQAAIVKWAPSSDNGYATFANSNLFENLKASGTLANRGGSAANLIMGDASAGTPGVLNSHLLYLDSMNILTSILDNNASACSTNMEHEGVAVNGLTNDMGPTVGGSTMLSHFEWIQLSAGYPRVVIRPRNLSDTGQPVNCNARSRPKPTVVPYREAIPALAGEYLVTQVSPPEEELPEWGYDVTVTVRYTTGGSNQEKMCQLSQLFTHKRVAPPRAQPTIVTTDNSTLRAPTTVGDGLVHTDLRSSGTPATQPANYTSSKTRGAGMSRGAVQRCNADPERTTVTARVFPRAGSMLYCRDRSRMRYVPDPSTPLPVPGGTPTSNFSYFSNIVNISPRTPVTPSVDRLAFIRHNWGFPGGTLHCELARGCRGFPPVPLGAPSGVTIPYLTTALPEEGQKTDPDGSNYLWHLYLPSLVHSGAIALPRAVPEQHIPLAAPISAANYNSVISSLFGTNSARPQANTVDTWGWVPCHQLTTNINGSRRILTTLSDNSANGCSRATGLASRIQLDFDESTGSYDFSFINLKRGCEIVVDVIEVDPARSLATVFNDPNALKNEFEARGGSTVTTISEYVAEQSPGSALCYDEANPSSYFFKCNSACSGAPAETPVPDYVEVPTF